MEKDKKAVETKVDGAATSTPAAVTTPTAEVVDYEAVLKEKDAELAKVKEEKENYRKGLLKAKGKLPEDGQADTGNLEEDADARTRRIVQETLLSSKEAQLQAEKDAALTAVLKRNKELETALKNRGQITSPSGQGSNLEKPEGKVDNYFSNEQIAALRARGFNDKQIEEVKKNVNKVIEAPRPA